jgi:hypothetical protein
VIELHDVRAISVGLTLICEMGGRRFGVPRQLILAGSQVCSVGDSGTLLVPAWFAEEQGLREDAGDAQGLLFGARATPQPSAEAESSAHAHAKTSPNRV